MTAADRDLQAAIAVTRFGLGARPGEIAAVRADPRGWLKQQVVASGAEQPQGPDGGLPSMRENYALVIEYQAVQRAIRQARRALPPAQPVAMRPGDMAPGDAGKAAQPSDTLPNRRDAVRPINEAVAQETLSRVQLGALTPAGFRERWTLFWANHFTVSRRSVSLRASVGPFEREAIRPHVFGRFADLLAASSRHPGMLIYLDQIQSIGPQSPAGRRRKAGLNENLAREILELHTVGVDAGYSQADVTEFARALTGWSMGGAASGPEMGAYVFRANLHEPGARTVMGRSYSAEADDQAATILADLAAHPATARHIARKLARHFVADDPPPTLVARLENAWIRTDGDLASVARALVDAPEAWGAAAIKLKTPYEFVVSSYRAAGAAPVEAARDVISPLSTLGQPPFAAPQPDGWSDEAADWAAPDALIKRLSWSRSFAARRSPDGAPVELARTVLGPRLSLRTQTAVGRAESRQEAFALLLMSPEFQRR